jgi:hypothetical protein
MHTKSNGLRLLGLLLALGMMLGVLPVDIAVAQSTGLIPPVTLGSKSLNGSGDGSALGHEFFLQPGSSWKGDIGGIVAGPTYSLVVLDIDLTSVSGPANRVVYFNLQDAESGSTFKNLGISVRLQQSGAGGQALLQSYQSFTADGLSSHGFNAGELTEADLDLRFDFTKASTGAVWTVTPYYRLSGGLWTMFFDGQFTSTAPFDFFGAKLVVGFDSGADGTLSFSNYYLSGPPSAVYVSNVWAGKLEGEPVQMPGETTYHTIGIDAFATIQDGIDAVVEGGMVYVAAGTFTVTSAINVNKEAAIIGAGVGQTYVNTAGTTSDPVTIFNVSADGVSLSDMTIQHQKTSNSSVEAAIALSNTSWPNYTPVLDFTLDSCRVEFMEFGITLQGGDWTLSGNEFVYTGPSGNGNRAIGVYGTTGLNQISNNTFIGSDDARTDFVYLTSSGYNETYAGTLELIGNTQTGGELRHFYIQDAFSGTGLALYGNGNTTTATNGNFILYAGGTISPLDHFTSIKLFNNSVSNVRGKGLLALDGDSGLKDAGSTTMIFAGNTLTNPTVNADGYVEATGSSGGLVGYKASVFNDFEVQKPPITYADDDWVGTPYGTDPDGVGPATVFGYDAFATVQDAIDGVADGGTVYVAAGLYDEDVLIDKTLTLLGSNTGISPVTGTRGDESVVKSINISGTVPDVTIDGFKITGTDGSQYGAIYFGTTHNLKILNNLIVDVYKHGISHYDSTVENVTIEHNKFLNVGPGLSNFSGIFTSGILQGGSISYNYIDTTIYAGMVIVTAEDLDISGNTVKNVPEQGIQLAGSSGGVAIYNNSFDNVGNTAQKGGIRLYGTAITGSVDVYGNIATNSYYGMEIRNATGCNLSFIEVFNNSFDSSNTAPLFNGCDDVLNASGNWYGVATPAGVAAAVSGDVDYTPWLASGTDTDIVTPGFQGDFSTLWVDDDSPQTGTLGAFKRQWIWSPAARSMWRRGRMLKTL